MSSQPTTTPRRAWRAGRTWLALAGLLLVVPLFLVALTGSVNRRSLDPESVAPAGARAVARLLEQRGVQVRRIDRPSGDRDVTVLVAAPELLAPRDLAGLGRSAGSRNVVVVGAAGEQLSALRQGRVDAVVVGRLRSGRRPPGCGLPAARVADMAELGDGLLYAGPAAAERCYGARGAGSLVQYDFGAGRLVLLGSADFLTNDRLAREGNAALALGLLSRHPRVDWVLPRPGAAGGPEEDGRSEGRTSLSELLPDRLGWSIVQVVLAVVVLAAWRVRRLGPVVAEPLPVVVRAAEAAEGRGRLYQAARARDRAAAELRSGVLHRLTTGLGLAADSRPEAVVAAVTARSRRDADAVGGLLYGRAPDDDAALVRLAADLDSLEGEVLGP